MILVLNLNIGDILLVYADAVAGGVNTCERMHAQEPGEHSSVSLPPQRARVTPVGAATPAQTQLSVPYAHPVHTSHEIAPSSDASDGEKSGAP